MDDGTVLLVQSAYIMPVVVVIYVIHLPESLYLSISCRARRGSVQSGGRGQRKAEC